LGVSFDAGSSSDADGTIVSYAWTFGDGSNAVGPTAIHIYTTAGTFIAVLTIIDDDGAMSTASRQIVVSAPENEPPTATFSATPMTGPAPLTVAFDASATDDPDGTIASFDWATGDGSTLSGVAPVYTYTAPGTYAVVLTVEDDRGAPAIATRTIQVTAPGNQLPVASFTADPTFSLGPPLTVNFDATGSHDPDGAIIDYLWNFGDGDTGVGATAVHTYTETGTFTVVFTVIDDDGVPASATTTIQVGIFLLLPLQPLFP